jgi:hypothetical protein
LPKRNDKPKKGGYGIYYHFDYVGDPRNYKRINTNNIALVRDQMHLAYAYGVKDIWIVNVGDLKPMEFPISFFLDYAWNADKWNADNLPDYYSQWSARQFGASYAKPIGRIMEQYAQYSARKKPELLDAETYSLENYNELQRVTREFDELQKEAEAINQKLPAGYRNAYFELVLHPILALANLQRLYTAVAFNHYYAKENNRIANKYAAEAKQYYVKDSLISLQYNQLNDGKWNHMMDQTHIGYTYWQQPLKQKMPKLIYVAGNASLKPAPVPGSVTKSITAPVPPNTRGNVFFELNGYVSMDAAHYSDILNSKTVQWKVIRDIGRDGDGITSFPVTAETQTIGRATPCLSYDFYVYDTGAVRLNAYFSPTLNFNARPEGLLYGISLDEERPQIISLNNNDNNPATWSHWVANNIIIKTSTHTIHKKGKHTLKYWLISPGIVLQKTVADFGGLKTSYLGPRETIYKPVYHDPNPTTSNLIPPEAN